MAPGNLECLGTTASGSLAWRLAIWNALERRRLAVWHGVWQFGMPWNAGVWQFGMAPGNLECLGMPAFGNLAWRLAIWNALECRRLAIWHGAWQFGMPWNAGVWQFGMALGNLECLGMQAFGNLAWRLAI